MKENTIKGFRSFLRGLFSYDPLKASITLILMVLVGIFNGISIAVLIPLLQAVGVGGSVNLAENVLSKTIIRVLSMVGLTPSLGGVLIIFFFLILVMVLLQYQQVKLVSILSNSYSAFLRKRLYEHIFNAQWSFFIKERMAHCANVLTVEAQRIRVACETLIRLISESIISLAYLLMAFLISWQTASIIMIAGITISWLMRGYIHAGRATGTKITEANNNLQSAVWEHLGGAKIIKSHAAEKQSARLFSDLVFEVSDLYARLQINQAGIKTIFDPITVAMLCAGLFIAINYLKMDIAYLLVLLFIFFRLSPKITLIQQSYHQLLTTIPAYSALMELEEETINIPEYTETRNKVTSLDKGVTLKDVWFKYHKDGKDIIKNVNTFFPKGQTVALVGESGSGKSTIADMVLGLLQPTEGKIYIDDDEMNELDIKSWRSLIGYVTQDTVLFHESIWENLKWANSDATYEDISNALKIAAADDFVNNLSEGYNTIIGDRGMRLSGGQRQRLALARALLRKPQLLILDEATSSLDAESEKRIHDAIEYLHGSITIIVIAHRLTTVRNADLIYIIDKGRISESGSWGDLMKNKTGSFHNMCELQGLS